VPQLNNVFGSLLRSLFSPLLASLLLLPPNPAEIQIRFSQDLFFCNNNTVSLSNRAQAFRAVRCEGCPSPNSSYAVSLSTPPPGVECCPKKFFGARRPFAPSPDIYLCLYLAEPCQPMASAVSLPLVFDLSALWSETPFESFS